MEGGVKLSGDVLQSLTLELQVFVTGEFTRMEITGKSVIVQEILAMAQNLYPSTSSH